MTPVQVLMALDCVISETIGTHCCSMWSNMACLCDKLLHMLRGALLAFATVLQIQNDICWNSKCFHQKTTFGQEKCTKVADRFKLRPILEIPQNPRRF